MDEHHSMHIPQLGLTREQSFKLYDVGTLPERTIRLLILQPGSHDAPIRCTLEKGSLSEFAGTYEALSYAWGLEAASEILTCNDLELSIRPNLAAALRRLRRPHLARRLWVDFLCINQADSTERGRQVSFMFDVYAQSEKVLLWLGESAPGSDIVMAFIAQLDAAAEVREHSRWRSRQRVIKPRPHALDHEPSGRLDGLTWPEAVASFLSRPWFRRFWVQQEAAACPQTVVICGGERVDWDNLFAFAWRMMRGRGQFTPRVASKLRTISAEGATSLRLIRLIHTNRQIHSNRNRSRASLLYVLHAARGCEAADVRDRIYSVQHLARQGTGSTVLLAPDYEISMVELCIQFAVQYIRQRGLAILAFAGRATQDIERASSLPSWVPDWENPGRHHFMGPAKEKAGGGRTAWVRVEDDASKGRPRLLVDGVILGTLETLSGTTHESEIAPHSQLSDGDDDRLAALASLEDATYDLLVGHEAGARYRSSREPLHQAYARTIVADSMQMLPGAAPIPDQCTNWRKSLQLALYRAAEDPDIDRSMAGSLADLQLREDTLQRTDSMPSVDSFGESELEALSLAEAGEEADNDPHTALARSAYALNVHKTGTYTHMQVARTAQGDWLALVPQAAKAGDELCIIQGFGRGLVVRKDTGGTTTSTDTLGGGTTMAEVNKMESSGRQRYELIGECYIHGAMRGEMAPPPKQKDNTSSGVEWMELELI